MLQEFSYWVVYFILVNVLDVTTVKEEIHESVYESFKSVSEPVAKTISLLP